MGTRPAIGACHVEPDPVQASTPVAYSGEAGPLKIGIVGMTHGHVEGLLWKSTQGDDIKIVGVVEANDALFKRLAEKYHLSSDVRFASIAEMIDRAHPEAVSVMTDIHAHLAVAEACAPRGVHMLFEKPLSFAKADAERIAELSRKHRVLALTNFETSWYASVREAKRLVESGEMSPVRKMVFRHGHKGPKEIGCSPEFLKWLTDPELNGGGAVVDFGCYGAVLSTWMMNGQRPSRIVASATTLKRETYPNVDDDATIILTYPTATSVIQASWAWTHDNKDMDVFTEKGSIHAAKWDALTVRRPDRPAETQTPGKKPAELENEWVYLRKVVRGECAVDASSSLELNVVVAEILDEARQQHTRLGAPSR